MTVQDVINILKEVQSLAKNIRSKPLNDAIVSLQESIISLSNNYLELEEKYNSLKNQVTISDNIYMDDDGFIRMKGDNRRYCPHCWNKERKLSLMLRHGIKTFSSQEVEKPYAFECSGCRWEVYSATQNFKE